MKKIYILGLMLMASATSFAQTTLWNGEELELGTEVKGWADSHRPVGVVVENPDKNGINTSDKCLKYSFRSITDEWDYVIETGGVSMGTAYRVSLMMKRAGTGGNVNCEFCGLDQKRAAWYDGDGEWHKIVFDLSDADTTKSLNAIGINASTDDIGSNVDIYIDNVVIEAVPLVNGTALSEVADASLSGTVTLTGAWMKGDCQNTNGDWVAINYDDFASLKGKLTAQTTSVVMKDAVLKNAYNAYGEINPNIVVYASENVDGDNVAVNGTATALNLNEAYDFNAPEEFTAMSVTLTRSFCDGLNAVCLPFGTTAAELEAEGVYAYKSNETSESGETTLTFKPQDAVAANTPFVAKKSGAGSGSVTFANKVVAATPDDLGAVFAGTYKSSSATDLWTLNADGIFEKCGTDATTAAFSAYAKLGSETLSAKVAIDSITGINSVNCAVDQAVDVYTISGIRVMHAANAADALFSLPQGIYIINNKKVLIK